MKKRIFLRNVHEKNAATSIAGQMYAAVHNTGNFFFEKALAKHIKGFENAFELEDLPFKIDVLLLSMSNFISPASDLSELVKSLARRKIDRIVMVGAGAQADDYGDTIHLHSSTSKFLHYLADRSESIGVRGHFTAEWLYDYGIKNVSVIGCPSAFWHGNEFHPVATSDEKKKQRAAINCTPHGHYRDKVNSLFAHGITNDTDYIAQSELWMLQLIEDVGIKTETTNSHLNYYSHRNFSANQLANWLKRRLRIFFDLDTWIKASGNYRVVYGSRFHGNMAAIQAGTPSLNTTFDTRTRELCEYLNLPHVHLEDFSEQMSIEEIEHLADFSLFNATYQLKLDNYREFLMENDVEPSEEIAPITKATAQNPSIENRVFARSAINAINDNLMCPESYNSEEFFTREISLRTTKFRSLVERKKAESGISD